MSILLWCKEITLFLLIGLSCNANQKCTIISSCTMVCNSDGPYYYCRNRGLLELPSFPESTVMMELTNNNLTSIPADVFKNNVALEHLELTNNSLTSIPADVFKNNVALEYLELTNNNLTSIPADVFKNNVALEYLYLEDNNLTNVPNGVFRNNVALLLLDLANNNLTSIPADVFKNNVALEYLYLEDNNLTNVPNGVFRNNVALLLLVLTNNNLTSIPADVFKNNVALEHLYIERNSLTNLPRDLFSTNVALRFLDLSYNSLTSISGDVFRNNVALTDVYITGNPIDIIEIHVFDYNNNIRDLLVDCSNCFDCDRLSISTCKWITKRVTDLRSYSFTCRNGVNLPNTVVNCSDVEASLAVTRIQNETSCNCNESSSIKSSSLEITTDTHPAMESTIDKVQHTTKTKDSSYTSIALIISGIAASFTLITAFIVLRKFKDTTSRIKHSDLTDTEHNSIINDGIDFIKTINYNGQMDKKYYNIPPKSHMNTLYNGIDVSKKT